jgi:hypothetical protein
MDRKMTEIEKTFVLGALVGSYLTLLLAMFIAF